MCLSAIYWARIPRLFFATSKDDAAAAGFDDASFFGELARQRDERAVRSTQMLRDEGLRVLGQWVENPDRVAY
jgi:tRNA(Arg) A34 adenosine deaminase TadA